MTLENELVFKGKGKFEHAGQIIEVKTIGGRDAIEVKRQGEAGNLIVYPEDIAFQGGVTGKISFKSVRTTAVGEDDIGSPYARVQVRDETGLHGTYIGISLPNGPAMPCSVYCI